MNDESTRRLGERIAQLRRHRAWSLSHLAERAGIAKSSLSRLEQGKGNPTIETLWRLALQLEIPFSALMAATQSTVTEADISIALLDRHHAPQPVDIYLMTLAPRAQRHATAHAAGTRETLQVIAGTLRAGTEHDLATLEVQDVHPFQADLPHAYLAGDQGATALITIFYPAEAMP